MKQTLVKAVWSSPNDIYREQIRDELAKRISPDKYGVVFNYSSGRPVSAIPPIRFVGGKKWQGLLAQHGYEAILGDVLMPYMQVLLELSGEAPKVTIDEMQFGLKYWPDSPVPYRLINMAIRDRKGKKDLMGMSSEDMQKEIIRQLQRFMDAYSLSGMVDASDLFVGYHEDKRIPMSKGKTILTSGTLLINGNLQGIWQIGTFQSLGHGRIARMIG